MYDPSGAEQKLMVGLANGRRDAAETIYRQHYPVVTNWIMAHGGDEIDAVDIFQEAMVVLFEKARGEDFELTCRIGTYLVAVSKRLWFKRLQSRRTNPVAPASFDFEGDEPGHGVWDDDLELHRERERQFGQLDQALEQLGNPCSALLKAFYHEAKSMQQIALEFGYTNPDNAKTQKYKCLARLRKLFYGVRL